MSWFEDLKITIIIKSKDLKHCLLWMEIPTFFILSLHLEFLSIHHMQ